MAKSGIGVGSAVSWGIQDSISTGVQNVVNGIVTQWDSDRSLQSAPCTNEIGQRIGERIYDAVKTANCTVMVAADVNVPSGTTPITISGVVFYAKSGRVVESSQDYRKISLRLEAWAAQFTPVVQDGVLGTTIVNG